MHRDRAAIRRHARLRLGGKRVVANACRVCVGVGVLGSAREEVMLAGWVLRVSSFVCCLVCVVCVGCVRGWVECYFFLRGVWRARQRSSAQNCALRPRI
jgi:hypothetical protein